MASLPYTPTTLISNSPLNDAVYIFQPGTESSDIQFMLLNVSRTLTATGLRPSSISSTLPFITDDTTSFTSFADSSGAIYAFAGNCGYGATGASVWVFDSTSGDSKPVWTKKEIMVEGLQNPGSTGGANYLASGMAFSTEAKESSELYLFGGMCPNSTGLTVETWQAAAEYSNSLFVLEESTDSAAPTQYSISELSSRGPPIPESGFSMTPLSPTFFNSSTGDVTQQQNFVLLGGQTDTAFINMSQVALFSLPEQTWSFLPVNEPNSNTNTDLAVRDVETVDPRSGHSAVLAEDGQSIVIFGGWVGDITSPADPQLAVLKVGNGYGGSGDWQWTVPDQNGAGPGTSGLYGHGAVMLPGNVLMIRGGYSIGASKRKLFRRAGPVSNENSYFYNVTSSSWVTDYTNPAWIAREEGSMAPVQQGSSKEAAGLGAGLGVGFAIILGLIIFYFFYRRRRKQKRAVREKDLLGLSLGASRVISPALGFGGVDGRGGEPAASQWMSERNRDPIDAYPWAPAVIPSSIASQGRGSEAERTGLLVEIPSPTRGLRRSLHSRGNHWYEDGRRSRGSGHIHSIDEREEYETEGHERKAHGPPEAPYTAGGGGDDLISTAPILDPFRDPEPRHLLDGSRSPSPPSPARERELEIQNWTSDWEAAGNLMQAGRLSPDKSDRTSSTLSDVSSRSMVSAVSVQPSLASIGRSISQRSAAIFSSRPISSNNRTNAQRANNNEGSSSPIHRSSAYYSRRRSQSLTQDRLDKASTDSTAGPAAAPTSFPALQVEGQALLLGSTLVSGSSGTPSLTQKRRRSAGWMGSIRRSIGGTSSNANSRFNASPSPDRLSTASSPTNKRARMDDNNGNNSGATNSWYGPQRSSSAGATPLLWRRQQGAKDWGAENSIVGATSKRNSVAGSSAFRSGDGASATMTDDGGSEDWDIESAVERRVVQMMFTVPRGELRVVNASPGEGEAEREGEEGEDRGEGEVEREEGGRLERGVGGGRGGGGGIRIVDTASGEGEGIGTGTGIDTGNGKGKEVIGRRDGLKEGYGRGDL